MGKNSIEDSNRFPNSAKPVWMKILTLIFGLGLIFGYIFYERNQDETKPTKNYYTVPPPFEIISDQEPVINDSAIELDDLIVSEDD